MSLHYELKTISDMSRSYMEPVSKPQTPIEGLTFSVGKISNEELQTLLKNNLIKYLKFKKEKLT